MPNKILCVAEKPSIARAVATHLSGGTFETVGRTFVRDFSTSVDRVFRGILPSTISKTTPFLLILVDHGETVL